MITLQCSKCGKSVNHKEAVKFIKDGWRHFGAVAYCPKCVKICKNIDKSPESMSLYLLHVLSLRMLKNQKAVKLLQKADAFICGTAFYLDTKEEKQAIEIVKGIREFLEYET